MRAGKMLTFLLDSWISPPRINSSKMRYTCADVQYIACKSEGTHSFCNMLSAAAVHAFMVGPRGHCRRRVGRQHPKTGNSKHDTIPMPCY